MTKNISEALKGNTRSLLWCLNELNRAAPRAPQLKIPPIKARDDIAKAHGAILNAVVNQKCPTDYALALFGMLAAIGKAMDGKDLTQVDELEARMNKLGLIKRP